MDSFDSCGPTTCRIGSSVRIDTKNGTWVFNMPQLFFWSLVPLSSFSSSWFSVESQGKSVDPSSSQRRSSATAGSVHTDTDIQNLCWGLLLNTGMSKKSKSISCASIHTDACNRKKNVSAWVFSCNYAAAQVPPGHPSPFISTPFRANKQLDTASPEATHRCENRFQMNCQDVAPARKLSDSSSEIVSFFHPTPCHATQLPLQYINTNQAVRR